MTYLQLGYYSQVKRPAKVIKNSIQTKKNSKIMENLEIIIKQFKCTTKTEYTENEYTFSAIAKASYGNTFEMRVNAIRYENGIIKSTCNSSIHYNTFEELEKEFKYHYELNKNNLFTTKIEITI